jgi:hypothetical protein
MKSAQGTVLFVRSVRPYAKQAPQEDGFFAQNARAFAGAGLSSAYNDQPRSLRQQIASSLRFPGTTERSTGPARRNARLAGPVDRMIVSRASPFRDICGY